MAIERSAGAIILITDARAPSILILEQNSEFYHRPPKTIVLDIGPKGHIEPGEDDVTAARREIREEIGLDVKIDTSFKAVKKYVYSNNGKDVRKKVTYFISRIRMRDVRRIKLNEEISRYRIVPIAKAARALKYKSDRDVIKKLREYLGSR